MATTTNRKKPQAKAQKKAQPQNPNRPPSNSQQQRTPLDALTSFCIEKARQARGSIQGEWLELGRYVRAYPGQTAQTTQTEAPRAMTTAAGA